MVAIFMARTKADEQLATIPPIPRLFNIANIVSIVGQLLIVALFQAAKALDGRERERANFDLHKLDVGVLQESSIRSGRCLIKVFACLYVVACCCLLDREVSNQHTYWVQHHFTTILDEFEFRGGKVIKA